MPTITVRIINADSREVDLTVTVTDNYASDPPTTERTEVKRYGEYFDYLLTKQDDAGSIEWTAAAQGYPDGGPISLSGLKDGAQIYVGAKSG